jgi:hypothetical protein
VKEWIKHANKVRSQNLCKHPGWSVAIDEMLQKFMGHSAETIRLKLKPDKEGYKFLALCCSISGYCYSFFPDGRLQKPKTIENILRLVDSLPKTSSLKYVLTMDNFL